MIRASLPTLLLASVLVSPVWAGTQTGVYSGSSKHYGKTIVSVPGAYYYVKVDSAGNVIPLAGSKITVAHEETGAGCHKVSSVSAAFQTTGASPIAPKPSRTDPDLCTFASSAATFSVVYPITGSKTEEDLALRRACQQRPAGTTKIQAQLPQLTSFRVMLEYAGGGVDEITYAAPMVSVTCESLALESASATPTTLSPVGGAVKLEGKVSSPLLAVTAVRARLSVSGKLTLVPLSLASGTAKSGVWSGVFQAPANLGTSNVKYDVTFEATDEKGSTSILTGTSALSFTVSGYAPKVPVLPTSTAKPAPTLPH